MLGITFLGVDIHLPSFNRKHIFNSMGPFSTDSMLVFLGVNEMNPCLGKTLKIQGGQSEFTTLMTFLKDHPYASFQHVGTRTAERQYQPTVSGPISLKSTTSQVASLCDA